MMSKWLHRFALGVLLVVSGIVGCAQQRPPINRVQANALDKHFFVGAKLNDDTDNPEFYWRNYVVGGTASQSLIGVGSWSGIDRIVWQITENELIARKAYEISKGADGHGTPHRTANGVVVAAYKIESHFDIKHDYNPQTGEQLNIVNENTTDRPWYEREYMRVDWSKNLVDNPMWFDMFSGNIFGHIGITPVSYYVSDPKSEDAPHFEVKNGYFDITNKFYVEPATTTMWGQQIPTCVIVGLFTGSATYDCNAQEATIRSSYWKIDPNADFEPLDITKATLDVIGNPGGIGDSFEAGIVTPGQQGWSPGYGYVDKLYHRYAHIHNIWQQSHQRAGTCNTDSDCTGLGLPNGSMCMPDHTCSVGCTSNVDNDNDGTADQCAPKLTGYTGSKGAQCDVAMGQCTIPYRDRQIKTVSYWVNQDTPADLLDAVNQDGTRVDPGKRGAIEDLIYSWNQLMSDAVGYAREVECRRTGDGDRNACHDKFFTGHTLKDKVMLSYGGWLIDKVLDPTPTLTLCHNPVRSYDDHDACGPTGATARVGDVRKNFVFYWPYASNAPWGGIADWNADPLTGQIIGGAACIMGRSATWAAAEQRDILQLAMGDTTVQDITDGTPAANYAHYLKDGYAPRSFTQAEIDQRVNSIDAEHATATTPLGQTDNETLSQRYQQLIQMQSHTTDDPTLRSTAQLDFDATAKPLLDTKYETQLVNGHWLVNALGQDPTTNIDDSVLDVASPLRGLDSGRIDEMHSLIQDKLRDHGMCFMGDEAPIAGSIDMQGVAKYFYDKDNKSGLFTDAALEKMYPELGEHPSQSDLVHYRGEALYHKLWIESVKGIGIHEIGHSLGMLHEFASSWDAMNYDPQYWQLRTDEGKATEPCNGPRQADSPDTCMGPRYVDPQTPDEQGLGSEPRPGIEYFGSTSVMEYQIERFGETVGLGSYDQHTMNALYGRVVETLDPQAGNYKDESGNSDSNMERFAPMLETQLTEQDRIIRPPETIAPGVQTDGSFATSVHYTELARELNLFDPARDCRPATPEEKAVGEWRVVHGKVCQPPPKDIAAWQDFESGHVTQDHFPADLADQNLAPYWRVKSDEKYAAGKVRWMFRWGTSHNAYFHTNDSDAGADPYEVTMNTIRKFDVDYPFTYFRRQNREYNFMYIPARVADRYFERMRSYHWLVGTDVANFGALFPALAQNDNWMRPYAMAETAMFNFLERAIVTPQPGTYGAVADPDQPGGYYYDQGASGNQFNKKQFQIDAVDGRYVDEQYDSTPYGGGSWDYLHWMIHAGFSAEKAYAVRALTDGRPNLATISRSYYLDPRGVRINFRNDMPQALDRLIGGILSQDWQTVAMSVPGSAAGDGAPPAGNPPIPQLLDLAQDTPAQPNGSLVVFPNIGYQQQLYSIVFTELFSRLNTDMNLINKMRLWLDGSVEQVTVPDADQIRFTDPASGYTYIARLYGPQTIDGKTVDKGIASRMLKRANLMLEQAYVVQSDSSGKPVLDKYGQPTLQLDSSGQPQVVSSAAVQTLTNYVGLLDATRQIDHLLGYGPL